VSKPCHGSPRRVPVDGNFNDRSPVHNVQSQHSLSITGLSEQFGSADDKPAPVTVLITYSMN